MAARFPRMQEYLDVLPEGVYSHPQARSKASLIRNMEESRHLDVEKGELPEPLYELLTNPPPNSAWTPTVPFFALMLAYGDVHFPGDDRGFVSWVYDLAAALYAKPLYRVMMYVASPKKVVSGATSRWGAFHQGTTVELVEATDNSMVARVVFPPRLFNKLSLNTTSVAWEAAIAAAGGRSVKSEVLEVADTQGSFKIRWE